uniref:DUF2199 domain-containing protein n=1 Tax=Neisseria gonorrhoeae TaxID=485 RepID=UPI00384AC1C7
WNAELNGTFDRQPVAAKFKYTREGAPRLEAAAALQKLNLAPYPYNQLSEEERIAYQAECDSDFCIIRYSDQTDRFIRAALP